MYIDKLHEVPRVLIHRVKIMERDIDIREYHSRISILSGLSTDPSRCVAVSERQALQTVLLNLESMNLSLQRAKKASAEESIKFNNEAKDCEKRVLEILNWYVPRW